MCRVSSDLRFTTKQMTDVNLSLKLLPWAVLSYKQIGYEQSVKVDNENSNIR